MYNGFWEVQKITINLQPSETVIRPGTAQTLTILVTRLINTMGKHIVQLISQLQGLAIDYKR